MTTTLYGIPNCDTVKKARTWLAEHGHDVAFHDFKKQGLACDTVAGWLEQVDWELLVNRKGTTWRKLPEERRAQVVDKASALQHRALHDRRVFQHQFEGAGPLSVGFSDAQYSAIFGSATA
jgi:arsenate reductase